MFRLAISAARAQLQMTRRNFAADLDLLFATPLSSIVSLAILTHSGRADLAGYALVAALLMSIGQVGVYIGSEILNNDRQHSQTLELIVASPAPYFTLLVTRIVLVSSIGVAGFVESWLIAWIVFGIRVPIHHPAIMGATVLLTIFAAAATSLITAVIFCFGKTTRTYQNAIGGPLYLLAGVLVPVTFLPGFLQPISRVIYLFWSADLLRDALQPQIPEHVAFRLGAIVTLGLLAGAIGAYMLRRLLDHLREEGTLGL